VTWGLGDYPAMAERLQPVADLVVARAGVGAGMEVLDVACGTGNAAIAAAAAGATVVGADSSPELLAVARARSGAVDWVERDMEDLALEDDRFDRVLSVFGAMYATRPAVVAGELERVCAPGGRIALAAWTPDSAMSRAGAAAGPYLPPPPGDGPPSRWSDEAFLRELFEPRGVRVACTRETLELGFADADEAVAFWLRTAGHVQAERARLEAERRWDALVADLRAVLDGAVVRADYVVAIGTNDG
jgi:SAM-dependent methyltransferase